MIVGSLYDARCEEVVDLNLIGKLHGGGSAKRAAMLICYTLFVTSPQAHCNDVTAKV